MKITWIPKTLPKEVDWGWARWLLGLGVFLSLRAAAAWPLRERPDARIGWIAAACCCFAAAYRGRATVLYQHLVAARAREVETRRLQAMGLATAGFAHELKNAITVLQGYAELAARSSREDGPPERTRELLADLDRQAIGMTRQLKTFLDLGGEAPERTKIPLTQAFQDVTKLLSPLARLRELSFEAVVTGDSAHDVAEPGFRQALLNLGLNAVQFATSRVHLEVKREEDACVVSVGDDGPGVPPPEEPLLFTSFNSSRPGGTGLGLSQVREAVEREGGTIHHERIAPSGARFVIRLPLQR